MDDSSYHVINLFQIGSYRACLSAYEALSSSPPSHLLTLYAARSHLALTPPNLTQARHLIESSTAPDSLDSRSILALADYLSGNTEQAVNELEDVLTELGEQGLQAEGDDSEGRLVRGIVATVWLLLGDDMRTDEAAEILREAIELGQDQECLGVMAHLYISLSQPQLAHALLTAPTTTAFTSDSLLSQLLQARTSLATGPKSRYEQAYYVYEEIKAMQGGRAEATLAGLAVAEASLGRWDEASAAVAQALELNDSDPTALANLIALARHTTGQTPTIQGSSGEPVTVESALTKLQQIAPSHPLLVDLADKDAAFELAAGSFTRTPRSLSVAA